MSKTEEGTITKGGLHKYTYIEIDKAAIFSYLVKQFYLNNPTVRIFYFVLYFL